MQPRAPERGNKASNLWLKTPVGVEVEAGETPSLTRRVHWGDPQGPTMYPSTRGISTRKGPICLCVVGEVTESRQTAEQAALFHLWPLPHIAAKWVATSWWTPKAPPLTTLTGALRQKNMAQKKEQIKASKTELSNKETANLSNAGFKTLVIRMLTEMVQ